MDKFSLLFDIKCHDLGIAPINHVPGSSADDMLNLLDYDSKTKAKRKYRKLWKKALKSACEEININSRPSVWKSERILSIPPLALFLHLEFLKKRIFVEG